MPFFRLFRPAMVVLIVVGTISCVKDLDFDEAGEIALKPQIQSDLLIFDLDEAEFVNPETNLLRTKIQDTVRLEFLDDDYIQKDLSQVEFKFRYSNSFPQTFTNKISFLSENNRTQHEVEFFIAPGSDQSPAVTEKIEFIPPERIQVIKRSIKMVVEIEVLPDNRPFSGELNFASKGLFFFEF